jgi:hypothetical protein
VSAEKTAGQFKASAIILISGIGDAAATKKAEAILHTYTLKISDQQNIYMAGRLISAFYIEFDPAHAQAIENELREFFNPMQLDVALELL